MSVNWNIEYLHDEKGICAEQGPKRTCQLDIPDIFEL